MATKGIFNLSTSHALVRKLMHDFKLFQKEPYNPYVAFNFFVTAEHIPDWIGEKGIRKKIPLLRICSHLANGAKHFETDPGRHKSIEKSEKALYCELGYVVDGYIEEPLVIYLSTEEAKEMGWTHVEAIKLAKLVLDFWLNRFTDVASEDSDVTKLN